MVSLYIGLGVLLLILVFGYPNRPKSNLSYSSMSNNKTIRVIRIIAIILSILIIIAWLYSTIAQEVSPYRMTRKRDVQIMHLVHFIALALIWGVVVAISFIQSKVNSDKSTKREQTGIKAKESDPEENLTAKTRELHALYVEGLITYEQYKKKLNKMLNID